ncbi:HD domain-containing protein [Sulfolobus sp. S-194]|uniref:HD domain-containing protein n=1 Tax=Sulfolobus sp. S-194 TaxID=2512240 RepID=UPI001436E561|nr:HD domain-containing protein [Sulfolobus sp. S-194]QIW24016.1 HD domain-containing protein [Sulfolobus sp. S-194]
MKIIRDPIHGYIEVPDDILPVISSPFFQRLRFISQTGLAYMVYPGMRHTRFEHSLGAMHLAKEFLHYISSNSKIDFLTEDYAKLVSLSALLHDIGHVAFSHTFESALQVTRDVYKEKIEYYGKETHVKYGLRLISKYSYLFEKVGKNSNITDPVKFLINVIGGNPANEEEKFALQIISNFVDADRGDYLLRDSYYAGVGYGSYDIERLKRVLVYVDGKIAILKKAIPIVEQFLLARMYMFKNVYFHSVVGMYNAILSHAISKLIRQNKIDLNDIEEITDYKILNMIEEIGFKQPILYRNGYKRIKKDITQECSSIIDREELIELMRETEGKIIYYEFFDVPYKEENEAIYIYDEGKLSPLSQFSNLITAIRDLKKAIIVYHHSMEDKMRKYYEKLKEAC